MLDGAINGAWRAEHTGNSTLAEMLVDRLYDRRRVALRRRTRALDKAPTARPVEIWSAASVARIVIDDDGQGAQHGANLEPADFQFFRAFIQLLARDCEHRRNMKERVR